MFKTWVGEENISIKAQMNALGTLDKGNTFKINCQIEVWETIIKRENFVNIYKHPTLRFLPECLCVLGLRTYTRMAYYGSCNQDGEDAPATRHPPPPPPPHTYDSYSKTRPQPRFEGDSKGQTSSSGLGVVFKFSRRKETVFNMCLFSGFLP